MKYEQAIIEFDKILEVEPKNVEAYLGKAEAYIALGDIENAIKVLQEGYDQTGDERLKDRIEELTAPVETNVATTTTVSETTTTTETPTVSVNDTEISSEPIEGNHYLNEAERMLLSYIRGEGEFIPDLVKNVTYLEIWGKDFVSVDERVFFEYGIEYCTPDRSNNTYCFKYKDNEEQKKYNFGDLVDLSILEYMPSLTGIRIVCNKISDLSQIERIKTLTEIGLFYNNINDITPLKNSVNLTELDLSNNNITDISPIAYLTNLRVLSIGPNSISDYSFLSELKNIEELQLYNNNFSDISSLTGLKTLKKLSLYGHNISDEDIKYLESSLPNCSIFY